MLDIYVRVIVDRLNPEDTTVPLGRWTESEYRGGGAANVAKNLAALGAGVVLPVVCGKDESGNQLPLVSQNEGYRVRIFSDHSRITTTKTRILAAENSRLIFRMDRENTEDISAATAESIVSFALDLMEADIDGVFFSDYAKGMLTPAVVVPIRAMAKKRNIPVFAAVKPKNAGLFKGVGLVSLNLSEAEECFGKKEPAALLEDAVRYFGSEIYLTLGARGIGIGSVEQRGIVEQKHRVAVADTSGCGDTMAAMLFLALLCGSPPRAAALFANAAAACTAEATGAVAPSPEEILEMLQRSK